jgi:hypothetical protein
MQASHAARISTSAARARRASRRSTGSPASKRRARSRSVSARLARACCDHSADPAKPASVQPATGGAPGEAAMVMS